MNPSLSPEERADADMLAEAVEMGVYGEAALRYLDVSRGTLGYQLRVLHHAGVDFRTALSETEIARALRRIVARLSD